MSSQAPVREGDVLGGKYRVEKVLGVGGMGVVVAAMHLQLDQRVALKFLLPAATANPEVVARFAREARAAARIKSEHVARVVDVGQLETGSPYMVMEFLEGKDLADVLAERGPLPFADAVGFVLQASDAIAEAHAAGLVHRDLKPANLFLARRPDKTSIVKVLDFGISKSTAPAGGLGLTSTQAFLGSPLYMSPEQLTDAKRVDLRSDIWALGVILYELLTARTPFVADTLPELVAAVLTATPTPIGALRSDVPPELAAIIMRCLSKAPADRFPSIAALAVALRPFGPEDVRHIPDRVSRVLGEESTPGLAVATPREIPRPDLAAAPSAPSAPAGAQTNARSAWSGTKSEPPVVPTRGLGTKGVVVAAGAALVAAGTIGVLAFQHRAATTRTANASGLVASDPASASAVAAAALPLPPATPLPLPASAPAASSAPAPVESPPPVAVAPAKPPAARPARIDRPAPAKSVEPSPPVEPPQTEPTNKMRMDPK
jgi:serine/threonine-protein kinase